MKVSISALQPSIITCENAVLDKTNIFPEIHLKRFEGLFAMFRDFGMKEQNNGIEADE